jgi:hypothetical protein
MTAYSLAEQELAARIAKLEEARGAEKSGDTGTLSARVKTVEGQVTDFSARLDAIEASVSSESKTPTKSTSATKK